MTPFSFNVTVTTSEPTGDVISAYFYVRDSKVHETREFADGAAFADYNKQGELVGIEILAPCRVTIVDQLQSNEPVDVRRKTKDFLKRVGPPDLIAA